MTRHWWQRWPVGYSPLLIAIGACVWFAGLSTKIVVVWLRMALCPADFGLVAVMVLLIFLVGADWLWGSGEEA